jgi:hypothetical protein
MTMASATAALATMAKRNSKRNRSGVRGDDSNSGQGGWQQRKRQQSTKKGDGNGDGIGNSRDDDNG